MATLDAAHEQPVLKLPVTHDAAVKIDQRARMTIFVSILLATLLAALDQTVVGTALPRIVTDLQGADRYVWVVTAYLLASTVTIPLYGKFSDVFGRKTMLLISVGLFLVGSMLSGLSQTMNQLIAFRALQGLGAGGIFPVALSTVGDLFDARERGRYQGLFGAVGGLSFLIGPFIGGSLTDHISWHWIFYVNVPFGLLALLAVARLLPNRRLEEARARDLDYLGTLVFVAALVPLLIGLTNKGELDPSTGLAYAWSARSVLGPIGAGLVLLVMFVLIEARAKQAIIPLDLFKDRDYALSIAAGFVLGITMFSAVIFMPRFYQTVRDMSATASGYFIWPIIVGLMVSAAGSGALISRTGTYKWMFPSSAVLVVVGGFLMTHLATTTPDWKLWLWMLPLGLGIGPGVAGLTVVVQSLVPMHRIGAATGTLTVARQLGIVMGLAVTGTVFASSFASRLPSSLQSAGVPMSMVPVLTRLSGALQSVGNGAGLLRRVLSPAAQSVIPHVISGANTAFAQALAASFWVTIIAAGLAGILTLLLRNRKLRSGQPQT
jgi:EmrB/QacA subfamily drug resistance transporter